MDIYTVLEIDKTFLKGEEYNSMNILARTWIEAGQPMTPHLLSDAIETAIKRSIERRFRYPPILLKRKRALDRGEWKPKVTLAKQMQAEQHADSCPDCGGTGFSPAINPTGPCETCRKYLGGKK